MPPAEGEAPETSEKKPSVPKFASFKPKKALSQAETKGHPSKEKDIVVQSHSRHREHDREHDREHRHKYGDRSGASRSRHNDSSHHDSNDRAHRRRDQDYKKDGKPDLLSDGTFFEDRLGDPENITYGRMHRYSVPRYRSRGKGNILGLGRQFRLSDRIDEGPRLVSSDRNHDSTRAKSWSLASGIDSDNSEFIFPEALQPDTDVPTKNYISLDDYNKRKRRRTGVADEMAVSSTGIVFDAETDEFEGSDTDEPQRPQDDDIPEDTSLQDPEKLSRLKLHSLSQEVKAHPEDLNAWLALIRHHDETINSASRNVTRAERIAQADIKLSLYEEAVSKVQISTEKEQLLLGLLQEGAKLWDTRKLANRWQQVIQEYPNSFHLRKSYLDFCQTNVLVYAYERCRDLFSNAMKAASNFELKDKEKAVIYFFLRITRLMYDSGFTEHSFALWQAVLEFSFFAPDGSASGADVTAFAEFWESEVTRIGETGAKGWRSQENVEAEQCSDDLGPPVDPDNLFKSWAKAEYHRATACSQPARTLDDVTEDDPYRVILFSDLETYLFRPKEVQGHRLLTIAWLNFCGLPPPLTDDALEWWKDPLLRTTLSDNYDFDSEKFGIFHGVTDTACLFASSWWMNPWPIRGNSTPQMQTWTQQVLRLLVEADPSYEVLAEYTVAHDLTIDPKESRKYAKALLKKRPSSLRLYNSYALVELRLGNSTAAERVWSTALSMSKTFAEADQRLTILLWKTWIWECLDRGEASKALKLLLAIPDGQIDLEKLDNNINADQEETRVAVLKALRFLESHLAHAKTFRLNELMTHYTECISLLRYLSSKQGLSSGLEPYNLQSKSESENSPVADQLTAQSAARLVYYHATTQSHSPSFSLSTTALTSLLRQHPSNTIILTIYTNITRHVNLFDRLRSTAISSVDPSSSIITSLHRIWLELRRPTYGGGTAHSVRAAFETAVSDDAPAAHSVLAWTWWVKWELNLVFTPSTVQAGQTTSPLHSSTPPAVQALPTKLPSKKSKPRKHVAVDTSMPLKIYRRGLRAVPWSKEFAMLAFADDRLRSTMSFAELRKIYETMLERDMRIRYGIEDLLDDIGNGSGGEEMPGMIDDNDGAM